MVLDRCGDMVPMQIIESSPYDPGNTWMRAKYGFGRSASQVRSGASAPLFLLA
jgi:hypothetical protein